jgi:hypothetical protein
LISQKKCDKKTISLTVYRLKRRDLLKTFILSLILGGRSQEALAQMLMIPPTTMPERLDSHIKDYLQKMENFDKPHKDDIKIDRLQYKTFESTVMRLRRLQHFVGHGNFNLLSLDQGLRIARHYPRVGKFTKDELKFMEEIFYRDATIYGFYGKKPLKEITERINRRDVVKIPYTGNYLYKGIPFRTFLKIKQQVGKQVVLTSGVRGIMKQFLLFLNKAYKHDGNLSLASRSLAPPGYSYHGIGDFDVGQVGFGAANFTERFTTTKVYKMLCELGYLKLRYPQKNLLGVRYEPWHVKIDTEII